MYTVRIFQPDDMFSVIKLASETLPERYNPSLFNYFYETFHQGFLVAEKLHKIVGFIVGVKTTLDTARVLMLSVAKQHRRYGIGGILLAQFLKEATLQNIKQVELEVRIDNKQAIKFYQKHSFDIINIITDFYQNGENAYLMRRAV